MTRKRSRPSKQHDRSAQSAGDRERADQKLAEQLADPLGDYRRFLAKVRSFGLKHHEDCYTIPANLIDLTTTILVSLLLNRRAHFLTSAESAPSAPSAPSEYRSARQEAFDCIRKLINRTKLNCSTFVLALLYIDRLKSREARDWRRRLWRQKPAAPVRVPAPRPSQDRASESRPKNQNSTAASSHSNDRLLEPHGCISTFLGAVICADKYLYDATYSNLDWVEFADHRFSLADINHMEVRFLQRLDYQLHVSDLDFDNFLTYLDGMLCLRQLHRWPSLTYGDLLRLSQFVPYLAQLNRHITRPLDASIMIARILMRSMLSYVVAVAVVVVAVSLSFANVHFGRIRLEFLERLYEREKEASALILAR